MSLRYRPVHALNVIGLMNVQCAIQNGKVYVLEVDPGASRTVPYVSKAIGVPVPKIAAGLMLGRKLKDYAHLTGGRVSGTLPVPQDFVKSPVFPFNKFPGVDPALGPEMRSTGEVMGVGVNFGEAFLKAQISAGSPMPEKGTVFIFPSMDMGTPPLPDLIRTAQSKRLRFTIAAAMSTEQLGFQRLLQEQRGWCILERASTPIKKTIQVRISRGERQFVAECLDLPVVTQANTLDELAANIREAIGLHLEGENLEDLGFSPNPTILATMELDAVA